MIERRAYSRFSQPTISYVHAVLRPGRVIWLVNLSAGGALIEARRPLRPGSRVYLHLWTDHQSAGRVAHVLRCSVASLAGDDGVRYRGAVRFDDEWAAMWEELTHPGYRMPLAEDGQTPTAGQLLPMRDGLKRMRDEGGCDGGGC